MKFDTLWAALVVGGGLFSITGKADAQTKNFVLKSDDWNIDLHSATANGEPNDTALQVRQSIPEITSPINAETRKINIALSNYAWNVWTSLGGPTRQTPETDTEYDFDLRFTQNTDSVPNVFSVTFEMVAHQHNTGGAPQGEMTTFNWVRSKSRLLTQFDVFTPGVRWQPILAAKIADQISHEHKDGPPCYFTKGDDYGISAIEKIASSSDRWVITKNGLEVPFDGGELATFFCLAMAPTITVSWSSLKPYLAKGGVIPE